MNLFRCLLGKRRRTQEEPLALDSGVVEIESQETVKVFTCDHEKEEGENFCGDCLASMAIRCAWCGGVIAIGDPITLYAPSSTYTVPDHAVRHEEYAEFLIGCGAWDCAWSAGDLVGVWAPNPETGRGRVERRPSILELFVASAADAMDASPEGIKLYPME